MEKIFKGVSVDEAFLGQRHFSLTKVSKSSPQQSGEAACFRFSLAYPWILSIPVASRYMMIFMFAVRGFHAMM